MKRTLRSFDIKKGGKYKVIATPSHWSPRSDYWPLGRVGTVQWINPINGVALLIEGKQERIVKPECLEEVVDESNTENKVTMNSDDIKVGESYKVIKIPFFWENHHGVYPVLNKIGKIKKAANTGCLMYFNNNESDQHFLPFECIEPARQVVEIEDDYLVKQIVRNPTGALKLIRGLAKMNKDICCRAIVERGTI